jgi:hypothetical protein
MRLRSLIAAVVGGQTKVLPATDLTACLTPRGPTGVSGTVTFTAVRRLSETSQFVMNMMGCDAFGSGGAFVPTIQKTRLIHAAVRHFLTASGRWGFAADGVPICQQDMVGALLIFSVQVVEGLRRVGISVTEQVRLSP